MSTYRDKHGHPAILLAFGYSLDTNRTTKVLAVRAGRVVVEQMTPERFEADYMPSKTPTDVAMRAIDRLARSLGCDLLARRAILFYFNAPAWRLSLVDCQLRFRALLGVKAARAAGTFRENHK